MVCERRRRSEGRPAEGQAASLQRSGGTAITTCGTPCTQIAPDARGSPVLGRRSSLSRKCIAGGEKSGETWEQRTISATSTLGPDRWGGEIAGASNPQILRLSGGADWVCKFMNAGAGTKNLSGAAGMALDMFGTRLARLVGLSVAECTSVDVSRDFIARTSQLEGFDAGPAFASKMLPAVVPVASGADVSTCVNAAGATLIVMLDLWLNNWDRSGNQKNTLISGVSPSAGWCPLTTVSAVRPAVRQGPGSSAVGFFQSRSSRRLCAESFSTLRWQCASLSTRP
jgi:hypothetical protein